MFGSMSPSHQLTSLQFLSPQGEPIRILVYKAPPYSLLGTTPSAGSTRTGEFHQRAQTPNKVLYCLILWLIGIYSSEEPKKTFQILYLLSFCYGKCLIYTTVGGCCNRCSMHLTASFNNYQHFANLISFIPFLPSAIFEVFSAKSRYHVISFIKCQFASLIDKNI